VRIGLHDPAAGWMSEEFQDEYLADVLGAIWDNPEIVGRSSSNC